MDWAQTTLQPAFLNGVFWRYYHFSSADKRLASIRRSIALVPSISLLDRILASRPFLGSDVLTSADIHQNHLFRWRADIERPSLPQVEAWVSSPEEAGLSKPRDDPL